MLILASASQTRKDSLSQAIVPFKSVPAHVDERSLEADALATGADARDVALVLARAKAEAVSAAHAGALVIGCDQTLSLGTALLHKPSDRAAAAAQLTLLRGKTHRLHAAVTLVRDGRLMWSDVQTAELTMRGFSNAERDAVLDMEGDAVLASAGAYRLEGPSIRLFETVHGDYFTILGLPLLPLLGALRELAPDLLEQQARP